MEARRRWMLGALGFGAASAAALAVLVLRDDHAGTSARQASSAGGKVFAALRARPVREPRLPGETCDAPQSFAAVGLPRAFPAEGALGKGPVHPVSRAIPRFLDFFPPPSGSSIAGSGWWSNETMWVSEPSYVGPVLVRGRKMGSSERVGFGTRRRPEWELRLPAGSWDEARGRLRIWGKSVSTPPHWRVRRADTRIRAEEEGGELCFFFQLDGRSFSQSVMFGAIVQR
jgi:hypothetical protein